MKQHIRHFRTLALALGHIDKNIYTVSINNTNTRLNEI